MTHKKCPNKSDLISSGLFVLRLLRKCERSLETGLIFPVQKYILLPVLCRLILTRVTTCDGFRFQIGSFLFDYYCLIVPTKPASQIPV